MKKANILLLSAYLLIFSFPAKAYNFLTDSGLSNTAGESGAGYDIATVSPFEFIATGIKVVLSLLGVIFLGLIIYSGYNWMMARGNDKEIANSKNTIIDAVIGLIIILAAYAITAFVGDNFASK